MQFLKLATSVNAPATQLRGNIASTEGRPSKFQRRMLSGVLSCASSWIKAEYCKKSWKSLRRAALVPGRPQVPSSQYQERSKEGMTFRLFALACSRNCVWLRCPKLHGAKRSAFAPSSFRITGRSLASGCRAHQHTCMDAGCRPQHLCQPRQASGMNLLVDVGIGIAVWVREHTFGGSS